jgi:hypothetical protein
LYFFLLSLLRFTFLGCVRPPELAARDFAVFV